MKAPLNDVVNLGGLLCLWHCDRCTEGVVAELVVLLV